MFIKPFLTLFVTLKNPFISIIIILTVALQLANKSDTNVYVLSAYFLWYSPDSKQYKTNHSKKQTDAYAFLLKDGLPYHYITL